MPKVSIIVPIYNAETNLHKCIDSILQQRLTERLTDIEVILVNDGSVDGSGKICDEYAEIDNRVRVLHIKNQGVSNARNRGIELASGDYIGFVDSDDWIEENMYSAMADSLISTEADIVVCGYLLYDGRTENYIGFPWGKSSVFESDNICKIVIPSILAPIDMNGDKQQILMGSVWKCLFRKEIIKGNGILFDTKIKYTEDTVFVMETFIKAKRISFINKAYYHFRKEKENRISTTQNYINNLYPGLKRSQEIICNIVKGNGYLELLQRQLHWRNTTLVIGSISNLCLPGSPYSFWVKVRKAKYYIRDSSFKGSLRVVGFKYFTSKRKILVLLMNYSLIALTILYYSSKLKR